MAAKKRNSYAPTVLQMLNKAGENGITKQDITANCGCQDKNVWCTISYLKTTKGHPIERRGDRYVLKGAVAKQLPTVQKMKIGTSLSDILKPMKKGLNIPDEFKGDHKSMVTKALFYAASAKALEQAVELAEDHCS